MSDEKVGYVLVLDEKQIKRLEDLLGECDAHEEWRSSRRVIGDVIKVLLESASTPNHS